MTIDEAIKILTQCLSTWAPEDQSEVQDAFRLGIEALTYINVCRHNPNCFRISPLPGESKEGK